MALPLSRGLDTKIPVSGATWSGESRGRKLHSRFFGAKEVRSRRVKRSDRPRSLDSVDTAKNIGVGLRGNNKG